MLLLFFCYGHPTLQHVLIHASRTKMENFRLNTRWNWRIITLWLVVCFFVIKFSTAAHVVGWEKSLVWFHLLDCLLCLLRGNEMRNHVQHKYFFLCQAQAIRVIWPTPSPSSASKRRNIPAWEKKRRVNDDAFKYFNHVFKIKMISRERRTWGAKCSWRAGNELIK